LGLKSLVGLVVKVNLPDISKSTFFSRQSQSSRDIEVARKLGLVNADAEELEVSTTEHCIMIWLAQSEQRRSELDAIEALRQLKKNKKATPETTPDVTPAARKAPNFEPPKRYYGSFVEYDARYNDDFLLLSPKNQDRNLSKPEN